MREIETKYRVADLEALLVALQAAGVELGEPVFQDDQAYAPAGWRPEMGKVGHTFARLRSLDGGMHVFTTKTPLANPMECAEYETTVADREQMHGAVLAMGFEPNVRIVKHRRAGRAGRTEVCVDLVEGVGAFLELELVVDDDRDGLTAQAELDTWACGLGVELERTTDTYDILVRAAVV
ncbi:adenylate cyclase class 2 [Nocardiopsis arvandica]|uniref:Adenylate cyclase class 2 n=1 Tax=Nocardiopsis sinuspersici TaxID=501010 RepID=A0A7Z0BIH4_9ACTN|nr:CYTH domain-containing protein [Nocardiopsis sinuspersici]NYH50417.1 adenylate cyclase class 2 [Nocardiopsis sinuspersici]